MNTQQKPNPTAAVPLPVDVIRESLELDPTSKTGLRWKRRPRKHFATEFAWNSFNGQFVSKDAGTLGAGNRGKEYWRVSINSRIYLCHRIVWFLAYGEDPGERHIDHINGSGLDNTPENLRLATQSENLRNRGVNSNNKSGIKGVVKHKASGKWMATINLYGRQRYLGLFSTTEAAAAAYSRAAAELHGEFARTA